jgi:hypothetical protein
VSVGKDVSGNFDCLANRALDGETATVDFGLHVFYHDFSGEGGFDGSLSVRG